MVQLPLHLEPPLVAVDSAVVVPDTAEVPVVIPLRKTRTLKVVTTPYLGRLTA